MRGDSRAAYYWHQHEKTKAAMHGRLVLHRGPLPRDEDGDYAYEGRADDMIKIGGLWVSPIEIENALVGAPARAGAAVVGVEVDDTSRIEAFVIRRRRRRRRRARRTSCRSGARTRLRRYEYPHFIEFVDDLPKTPTGKIQRYKLREA